MRPTNGWLPHTAVILWLPWTGDLWPWQELDRLLQAPAPQPAFEQWVTTLRDAGRLRNDDVTLMLLQR